MQVEDGSGDPELRLLIVEDDVVHAELVVALLAEHLPDAVVDVAPSMALARPLLAAEPDLVLADLALPGAVGLEVVAALRTACPETAVVVMVRRDDADFALAAIAAGADDCLVKGSLDAEQLCRSVLRAVQRARSQQVRQRRERFAASLLDAGDSPTCAVDGSGIVISVNAPWRAFTEANGGDAMRCGVGVDYLAVCDEAIGERIDGAAAVSAGLRDVLAGRTERFEHEYAAPSPGQQRWFSVRIARQGAGDAGAVISHIDVTAGRLAERVRSRRTLHDPVTGLPNAVLLGDRLEQALAEGSRSGTLVALGLLDVQDATAVVQEHGPAVADALMVQIADRLTEVLRDGDTLAQLGGARFAVVWRNVGAVQDAQELSARLAAAIRQPFVVLGRQHEVTGSIGVAVDQWAQTADELLLGAAAAMHDALPAGPVRLLGAEPSPARRQRTENELRTALDGGQLVVFYQPVVDLTRGVVVGVEALVRWQHPVDGLVPPEDFIPVAESGGLIVALGAQVLEQACRQAVSWHDAGLPLHVAVNISTRQVAHPELVHTVQRVLRQTGLDPGQLVLEVTESAVMEDAETAATVLATLADLGLSLSIDDFGTGYSSLVYLKRYPIGALKVDRTFVAGMGVNARDDAIVASVVGLARAVGGSCIAEGVETVEQYEALLALGCAFGQGWLFGRAVPADELPALVQRCEQEMAERAADAPAGPDQRDHAGHRRDQAAELRDHAGDQRDQAGDARDEVADLRDALAMVRDLAGDERDLAGDERDQVGAVRDREGTRRDLAADRRDDIADERDRAADQRDQAADQRDVEAEIGEAHSEPASTAAATALLLRTVQARREAASDRVWASQDRDAGAGERLLAELDRETALRDRGAGAGERSRAVLDRDTALADRGAGAGERSQAVLDRDTALADRDAGAVERSSSEADRQTSSTDRGASARERVDANVDSLTGAHRRGPGFLELQRDVDRVRRTDQSLVVAFVDVDGLKIINDRLGHAAGDQVLVQVAQALRAVLRPYDLLVRYGGDEFICVLTDVAAQDALVRMAEVQHALAPGAAISVGVAVLGPDDDAHSLVARADAELYRRRGR